MSITTSDFPVDLIPPADPDPFRYGWRYVKARDADGKVSTQQVPLTLEDVLHPEEGDFIVHNDHHDMLRVYLRDAARTYFADRSDVFVTSDSRVDWGSKYGWIHGPDWALFSGNQKPRSKVRGTLKLKEHKAKIECVVEITSASTRGNDFVSKKREYFLVGVPYYIIVDAPRKEEDSIRLFGFKAGKKGFLELKPDERGRLPFGELSLWIGAEHHDIYLEDAQGQRLLGFEGWQTRARQADERAEAERAARLALEIRIKALEEELARRTVSTPKNQDDSPLT